MTLQLVYNTTDTIAVVDGDGRTIGGREWGSVESTDAAAKRLLANGDLVPADEAAAREAKLPAIAVLDDRRQRAEQAQQLAVAELREAAGVADGSKSQLVQEIAADPSIQLPPAPKAKSGRSSASSN